MPISETPRSTCMYPSATSRRRRVRWNHCRSPIRVRRNGRAGKSRNEAATLGGGRYHSRAGQQLPRTPSRLVHLATSKSVPGDYLLPHRSVGRASGPVLRMRLSRHLLLLLPKPALSEMSDQCPQQVAGRAFPGTTRHRLLSPGFHSAPSTLRFGPTEQNHPLRPAVACQCRNVVGGGCRSQAPRSRNRLPQRAAHLGAKPPSSSPRALRDPGRWSITRPLPLGPFPATLFLAAEGAQPRLSRQIRGWAETRIPPGQTRLSWTAQALGQTQGLSHVAALAV